MKGNDRGGDELRRLLERGDPAGDGSEPTSDDWARMKRAMLHASKEPRALRRVGRALLVTATVAAVAIVAIRVARVGRHETTEVAPPPTATARVEPRPAPSIAELTPSATPSAAAPIAARAPAPVRRHPARLADHVVHEPRTVRFVTASGTQIVWTLDPNFKL
jgi:cytochrome c-type biogenesis protein CcmH/NrfG